MIRSDIDTQALFSNSVKNKKQIQKDGTVRASGRARCTKTLLWQDATEGFFFSANRASCTFCLVIFMALLPIPSSRSHVTAYLPSRDQEQSLPSWIQPFTSHRFTQSLFRYPSTHPKRPYETRTLWPLRPFSRVSPPPLIRPWPHFSARSASYICIFFSKTLGAPNPIDPTDQIWQWKEAFNFVNNGFGGIIITNTCTFFTGG